MVVTLGLVVLVGLVLTADGASLAVENGGLTDDTAELVTGDLVLGVNLASIPVMGV